MKLLTPSRVRRLTQAVFLLFILRLIIGRNEDVPAGAASPPSAEAYCPLGGLATLGYWARTSSLLVSHAHLSNIVLLLAIVFSALLFKSAFCGWICPFGTIQEWLTIAGRRLGLTTAFRKLGEKTASLRRRWPDWVQRPSWLRYVVLAWVLLGTATYARLVFRDWDPYAALLEIRTPALTAGTVVLIITVVASLFTERPWCKYLCPLGALIGLLGRVGLMKVNRHAEQCTLCHRCTKACPMGIDVQAARRVGDPQCISCLACVESCPSPKALSLGPVLVRGRRAMRLLAYSAVMLLSVVLITGTVKAAQVAGLWSTSGKVDAKGNQITATGTDPNEIKGWMTMGEVLTAYKLDKVEVYQAFGIAGDLSETTQLKDIEKVAPSFNLSALRNWITEKVKAPAVK